MDELERRRRERWIKVLRSGDLFGDDDARSPIAEKLATLAPDTVAWAAEDDLGPGDGNAPGDPPERKIPAPRSVGEILAKPEPTRLWLAEGLVPIGANVLVAGYPKSFKTFVHMELAVAAATGTPFLGKFETAGDVRTGMVLMEGGEREQARRLDRICQARGLRGEHLDGFLHVWHRPPLRFSDPVAMHELGLYALDLELDVLTVDAWAYASSGSSNEDFTVTPQLMALSRLRKYRPDLTVVLIHHARKSSADPAGERLTDIVRGSGAFGAWYDACLVLARKDENSPHVSVRTELREYPSPDPFVFTVEDEEPARPGNDFTPQGALSLRAEDFTPQALKQQEKAREKIEEVVAFVSENLGCSKREVRGGVTGRNAVIDAAVEIALKERRLRDDGSGLEGMRLFLPAEGVA